MGRMNGRWLSEGATGGFRTTFAQSNGIENGRKLPLFSLPHRQAYHFTEFSNSASFPRLLGRQPSVIVERKVHLAVHIDMPERHGCYMGEMLLWQPVGS